jgi:hypothetical protein
MTVQDPQIVVEINNERIVLVGTPEDFVLQSDNKEYLKTVKESMDRPRSVPLIHGMPYALFQTGRSTFLELTASLVSANAGQAIILDAPDEVTDELDKVRGPIVPGVIY